MKNHCPGNVNPFWISGWFIVGTALFLLASLAYAQKPIPGPTQTKGTMLAGRALERIGSIVGLTVLADSTVAFERVSESDVPESARENVLPQIPLPRQVEAEAQVEKQIAALVQKLPRGTVWAKLFLPALPPGRAWKGDDVAAFAYAQARLFGPVGAGVSDGSIEILGKRVGKESAPPFVAGLDLKTVYIVSNPRREMQITGGTPWSAASQAQWEKMTDDERRIYGQQQAGWIMSLPSEQRDLMLDKIRQHDQYFETVKGPLEKLLGKEL